IPLDVSVVLQAIYSSPNAPQVCVSNTGSGGQALAWMLGVPGASTCLLEATVPYCMAASQERVGVIPDGGYCSQSVADALAWDAYRRAVSLCVSGSKEVGPRALAGRAIIGLGCTAAVASSRPKKGDHRCFVAAHTHTGVTQYSLKLAKGQRDRVNEDVIISRLMIRALAEAAGIPLPPDFKQHGLIGPTATVAPSVTGPPLGMPLQKRGDGDLAGGGDLVQRDVQVEIIPEGKTVLRPDPIDALVAGEVGVILFVPYSPERNATGVDADSSPASGVGGGTALWDEAAISAVQPGSVVFPGSYNPLHIGHVQLMEAARSLYAEQVLGRVLGESEGEGGGAGTGGRVGAVFELSVANADKGGLRVEEVRQRTRQFIDPNGEGYPLPVALTRAPLFVEK
ncbi:unnamed protein product, partial [Choristocarpus tenellus]